jgi:predicted glutamine amidotransferase
MACRMLVATGQLPLRELLDGFRLMALNQNEEHEYRHHPDHLQGDGWGVVTRRDGHLEYYRSVMPCWQDPRFTDLYQADPDFIMLHARKASPGIAVRYEFTHPFYEDGWYFCHNGTVHDFAAGERSDAQQLFALLLQNMRQCSDAAEAVSRTVSSLEDYSALNFMLFRDGRVYVLNKCGKRGEETPNYFTIKYLQVDDYAVVSSERLPNCGREWQEMENRTLLTMNLRDRSVKVCPVWAEGTAGLSAD